MFFKKPLETYYLTTISILSLSKQTRHNTNMAELYEGEVVDLDTAPSLPKPVHLPGSAAVFDIPSDYFLLEGAKRDGQTIRLNYAGEHAEAIKLKTLPPRRRRLVKLSDNGRPLAVSYELPLSGFREYLLFALKSRIMPSLQHIMGRGIRVTFVDHPVPKMKLSEAGIDTEPRITREMRDLVDSLLERETTALASSRRLECLLLSPTMTRYLAAHPLRAIVGQDGLYERIPRRWLRTILPFVPFSKEVLGDPEMPVVHHRTEAESGVEGGGLFADCMHTASSLGYEEGETPRELYARLSEHVLGLVRLWYDKGYIAEPETSLVTNWELEPVTNLGQAHGGTLYKTKNDWGMTAVTQGLLVDMPVTSLLWELNKGRHRQVAVHVGGNLVDYHVLTNRLFGGGILSSPRSPPFHFADGSLHFTPNSLTILKHVLDTVDATLYGDNVPLEPGSGPPLPNSVLTLDADRISWLRVYNLVIKRSISADTAVYIRRDVRPVFVLSFVVPPLTNALTLRAEILLRSRRLMLYIMNHFAASSDTPCEADVHSRLESFESLPPELERKTVREILSTADIDAIMCNRTPKDGRTVTAADLRSMLERVQF